MISSLRNAVSLLALLTLLTTASTATAEFKDGNKQLGISPGGKAAFIDYNNDGWIDLFAGQLWKNEGGKKFVLAKDSKAPGGEVIWGDFDNDGNVDVFQFTGAGSLHRNKGDGTFEAVPFPKLPTVNSRGAVWLDINNDGLLDLYVGGYEIWTQRVHPDAIFINQGGGKFAKQWQNLQYRQGVKEGNYSARGVTAGDFNEDGFVDVYVANYRLQPNHLWQNNGKGHGKFTNVAMAVGAAGKPSQVINYTGGIRSPECGHTIGSCFGDMDNDGHLDIFVGNFAHGAAYQNRSQFLRNLGPKGKYKFEDKSAGSGLGYQESYASPALGDFDNDGDLDLFFTTVYGHNHSVLYSNEGGWKFKNITAPQGLGSLPPTYQSAWGDIDNDGDLDLATAGKLWINQVAATPKNKWIALTLEGDGKKVNRSAIGAIARIKLKDRVLTRQVESGTGEGNQNQVRLHFGLGAHEGPVDVEITWLGAGKQMVKGLAAGKVHKVTFKATAG